MPPTCAPSGPRSGTGSVQLRPSSVEKDWTSLGGLSVVRSTAVSRPSVVRLHPTSFVPGVAPPGTADRSDQLRPRSVDCRTREICLLEPVSTVYAGTIRVPSGSTIGPRCTRRPLDIGPSFMSGGMVSGALTVVHSLPSLDVWTSRFTWVCWSSVHCGTPVSTGVWPLAVTGATTRTSASRPAMTPARRGAC